MGWLILLLVLVVAAVVVGVLLTRNRSAALRRRFGREYDRAVTEHGDRRRAEAGLRAVEKRHVELDIQPLPTASRDRYQLRWRDAQARFVDGPLRAVAEADALVGQVLRERGYPTGDFDEQVALVAVDHGDRADDYRRAYAIHRGVAAGATDDLRDAFLHYRAVFEALMADAVPEEPDEPEAVVEPEGPAARGEATAPEPEAAAAAGPDTDVDTDVDADADAERRVALARAPKEATP